MSTLETKSGVFEIEDYPDVLFQIEDKGFCPFDLLPSEIQAAISTGNGSVKCGAARLGLGVDVLAFDKDSFVRVSAATNLAAMKDAPYRHDVHAIEEFTYDYFASALSEDKNGVVRALVVETGYCDAFDALDKSYMVRTALAEMGFALDVLFDDVELDVRIAAGKYLDKHNLSVSEWAQNNPDLCLANRIVDLGIPLEEVFTRTAKETVNRMTVTADIESEVIPSCDIAVPQKVKSLR